MTDAAADLTAEERAELLALREAATPGEWRLEERGVLCQALPRGDYRPVGVPNPPFVFVAMVAAAPKDADAEYIVAACNAVPRLLTQIKRLEARRPAICPRCGGDPDIPATREVSTPDGPMETWDGVSTYRCDNCENGAVLVDP